MPLALVHALVAAACCADLTSAQVPDLPGWDLVWNDEFDGASLDTSKWTALDRRDSFNNEKQYYHPDQVTVSGGNLQLTAIDVPRSGKDYQSGLITSNGLFGPGRFEARIDLPTSQGMWPAFWLNANHIPWPQGGEIDILENRGSQPNLVSSAYHWQTDPGPCCDQHQYVFDEYTAIENGQPVDFHAGFHTYAAEWDETTIRYYVDDNLHYTVTEAANRPVFETAKNIIVNLAVGGDFGGDPDGSTVWPQTMYVDYVRYWQRATPEPSPDDNLLLNADFDNGTLSDWDVFGNAINNVTANSQLVNDGSHSLKLYGQFNGAPNESGVSQGVQISGGESLRAVASSQTPWWDTLFGKSNEVTMRLEFFSAFGALTGSSDFLGEVSQVIHDGSTQEDVWFEHELEAIAPADAVEARVSFIFDQPGSDNGALWIDSVGLFDDSTITGDYNGDGVVNAADYTVWRDALEQGETTLANDQSPGEVDWVDFGQWYLNYGSTASESAATVPEPTGLVLVLCAAMGRQARRR